MKSLEYKGVVVPIIYECEDYVVIDKPENLIVELSYESEKVNLKQIIIANYRPSSTVTEADIKEHKTDSEYNIVEEFKEREGLVHRLDADTSGVMVIAKTLKGFIHLKNQFLNREVHKKYIAITYERFAKAELGQIIEINAPIGRNLKNRTKFIVSEEGKPSITQLVQTKFLGTDYTLWDCIPKTGRTHQIRVHLTSLNCPILGDTKYSGLVRSRRDKEIFNRLFLHAYELGFMDLDGKEMIYTSDIPTDFINLINEYSSL